MTCQNLYKTRTSMATVPSVLVVSVGISARLRQEFNQVCAVVLRSVIHLSKDRVRIRLMKYLREQYDIILDLFPIFRDRLIDILIDDGFDATFSDFRMILRIPKNKMYLTEGDSFHMYVLSIIGAIAGR